jgi:hypothetical protein
MDGLGAYGMESEQQKKRSEISDKNEFHGKG